MFKLKFRDATSTFLFAMATIALGTLVLNVGCQPSAQTAKPEAAPQPQPEAQRAAAGVGKQGQKLEAHNPVQQLISGPAIQFFRVRDQAVFDIQIPHALQLYKAEHGKVPKSHDEFIQKIIQPNAIELPELRDGLVYQFNPEKEELWVYPAGELENAKN